MQLASRPLGRRHPAAKSIAYSQMPVHLMEEANRMAEETYKPPTAKATGADKTVHKALGLSGGIFGACPCAVDVKDGKIVRIRPLHWDSASTIRETLQRRGRSRRTARRSSRSSSRSRLPGASRTRSGPTRPTGSSTRSRGWTGTPRASATRRTAARASTCASPGMKRPQIIADEVKRICDSTALWPSWCRATATANARWCTRLTAAPRCCSTRWAGSPSRSGTRTAGKAGTGAPSTCGARASSA